MDENLIGMGQAPDGLGVLMEPMPAQGPDPWVETPAAHGMAGPVPPMHPMNGAPAPPMYPVGGPVPPMHPVAGTKLSWVEPNDTSPAAATRSAGLVTLFAVVGGGIGFALGGGLGAVSGILVTGAAVNGYRAQKWWGTQDPSEQHEVMTSTVFALLGAGAGIYTGYKAYETKKKK